MHSSPQGFSPGPHSTRLPQGAFRGMHSSPQGFSSVPHSRRLTTCFTQLTPLATRPAVLLLRRDTLVPVSVTTPSFTSTPISKPLSDLVFDRASFTLATSVASATCEQSCRGLVLFGGIFLFCVTAPVNTNGLGVEATVALPIHATEVITRNGAINSPTDTILRIEFVDMLASSLLEVVNHRDQTPP